MTYLAAIAILAGIIYRAIKADEESESIIQGDMNDLGHLPGKPLD